MMLETFYEGFNPETTLNQMGGKSKIISMTGAKDFIKGDNYIAFKYKGSKDSNYVKITLNNKDLYDMEFKKIRGMKVKDIKEYKDVYAEDLKPIFEKQTGLYLSL